jgi:hypothetical protein
MLALKGLVSRPVIFNKIPEPHPRMSFVFARTELDRTQRLNEPTLLSLDFYYQHCGLHSYFCVTIWTVHQQASRLIYVNWN